MAYNGTTVHNFWSVSKNPGEYLTPIPAAGNGISSSFTVENAPDINKQKRKKTVNVGIVESLA